MSGSGAGGETILHFDHVLPKPYLPTGKEVKKPWFLARFWVLFPRGKSTPPEAWTNRFLYRTSAKMGGLHHVLTTAGAAEGEMFSCGEPSAPVSASWLGSLAALSAATRTRAPKRATGTFLSLRSCPVRASARADQKETPLLRSGVSFWSGRRGSNSLPRPWQGRALPDELRPQTQDTLYCVRAGLSSPEFNFPRRFSK